jgi:membrane protein implicated in regulation of membrane protease activity
MLILAVFLVGGLCAALATHQWAIAGLIVLCLLLLLLLVPRARRQRAPRT